MKHTIAYRIADFLKYYHPFSELNFENLLTVAQSSSVLYMEKNEVLFKINDEIHDSFYVIASGAVGLSVTSDTDDVLIDKCDEGDILGLRPFFAQDNYLVTAKMREDSILYAIPIEAFKPIAFENKEVLNFLLRSFASNTRNPFDDKNKGKLISENIIFDEQSVEIQYYQPISYSKKPLMASASDTVKSVAQTMTFKKTASILIHKNKLPIGIVTDKDLRSKIATGFYAVDTKVDKIMTSPVITVADNLSIAQAQMLMLKYNVSHLCVTVDGTNQSEIIGVISEHDIVVAQANNPGVLLKQISKAEETSEIKNLREKLTVLIQNSIDKNIPINHICSIVGEIHNAIIKRCIDLSIEKLGSSPAQFAWINIGSQGRKEQLLLTDQDNAIIFEDVEDNRYDEVKEYFLSLGKSVNKMLNEIGFSFSPDDLVAGNESWCKSLTDWQLQFKNWIVNGKEKDALKATIFFDYDFVLGDETLVNLITETIQKELQKNELFFAYLGAETLKNPPPLGFFRQFLVENDGEHKDTFDIKSRAIDSLVDAARILALHNKIHNNSNTAYRFIRLAEIEPQNATIYEACSEAFLELLKFRTIEGLLNDNDGKYINLNELSKLDKVKLKNSFQPISEIQEILKNRFQLTYFS